MTRAVEAARNGTRAPSRSVAGHHFSTVIVTGIKNVAP